MEGRRLRGGVARRLARGGRGLAAPGAGWRRGLAQGRDGGIREAVRISAFLRGPVGTFLRYACSLGLLGWLAGRVDWARLGGLRGLDWSLAAPAVLLAGLAYPLQAWRWQVLLRTQDIVLPFRWVHGVFWIGQFYNSFLPGGVAGDAVRLAQLWQVAPARRAGAAASLLAERLLGLGALLALATLALGAQVAFAREDERLRSLLVASVTACALLTVAEWSLVRPRWWEPVSTRVLGAKRAAVLHDAAVALGARGLALTGAATLSVGVWLVDFLSLWLLAGAVGVNAGLLTVAVAAAAAYVAASLPVSIGGHGVREVSLVTVLGWLGHGGGGDGGVALLALAFWALSVAWCLVGGVVQLLSVWLGWPVGRRGVGPEP